VPSRPLTMHQIRESLRLAAAGLSQPQIARALKLSQGVVNKYLQAARAAGLSWPLPDELSDQQLRQLLFPKQERECISAKVAPDFALVHQELKRKGVTQALLWEEYAAQYPGQHYSYTRFTELYQLYRRRLRLSMRQIHRAGEKIFIDYAGLTVDIIDPETGQIHPAQIFIAVLGASNYTFAEATWTQSLPDWIGSHTRALAFIGGVPEIAVIDNLKSGVTRADRYEPIINRSYQEMLAHYGMAAIPARPRRPRDKAKVEFGVELVERWILARLRHRQFFSLAELNQAINTLLENLNHRPFKKLPGSRRSQLEALDRPALKPLPATPYEYAEWLPPRRLPPDYHMEADGHYYSAPHQLIDRRLDLRLTASGVEIFHQSQRVAVHPRSDKRGAYTTNPEHMPEAHRLYRQGQTPETLLERAGQIGPATHQMVQIILQTLPLLQQSAPSCFGLLSLAGRYTPERLEAACRRALSVGTHSRRSVLAILQHRLDQLPLEETEPIALPSHANIRGADYYQQLLSAKGDNLDAYTTNLGSLTPDETAGHG
jgi:transposase